MRDDDHHTDDQYNWHMRAIADAVAQWRIGEINMQQKHRLIAEENRRYYGTECLPLLSRIPKRYALPYALGDALGVDEEIMDAALSARRAGSVMYRQLLDDGADDEVARSVLADGLRAYRDILAAGGGLRAEP